MYIYGANSTMHQTITFKPQATPEIQQACSDAASPAMQPPVPARFAHQPQPAATITAHACCLPAELTPSADITSNHSWPLPTAGHLGECNNTARTRNHCIQQPAKPRTAGQIGISLRPYMPSHASSLLWALHSPAYACMGYLCMHT